MRRTTTGGGRIGHCGCGRRVRHRRFLSRFRAGSGVDRSWAGSSTSTRRPPETAGQPAWPHSGTQQAYVARRTAEGKTVREIKRCLKRYITRELFRALTATMTPTTNNPVIA